MASNNDSGIVEATFPTISLVPKSETGVLNFLQKYPDYDGRDTVIAIFDSGVDPRASGLETICDGKTVKVIERYDCTGCGDVDVSKKVKATEKGFITGLSGRQLKLTPEMTASNTANGEYRIGLKTLHDLCPSKVRENIINYNKTKYWDGPNKTAIAGVTRKIVEFESQNTDLTKLPWDKKLLKEDLDYTLDMLNSYDKMYKEFKTSYDCILYQTSSGWRAVVDTTEKGDLEQAVHIGEYSKTREIKNVDDFFSISINVHDNGDVLEIVGMCSSHGTHVASIASGNHASKDVDGVAPNARIVSLTIGDGRLGSMETGTALVRAMMKVMELCRNGTKIDVINMSYGEHAHWSNTGRIGELMSEVVNKYGVVWVASAGNHGPALATVGTPPDIAQPSCIGVGAYVSPQMMEAEYVMREKLPGNVYTWSSRDPCIDGGQGVTVCAPGGAITSVPQFTMSKSQLMNGTSMAAPHVAGAISLLISALKQKGIKYSPYSIKRALTNTATKLSYVDPFAQGSGLLNVEKAFEYLTQHENAPENMLRFSVRCGAQAAKGIHIRQGILKKPMEFDVTIEPIFFNELETEPHQKFNFNVRLNLISSKPFVQCGSFLDLSYSARSLCVKVDPTGLEPGVHTALISAYDTNCVQKGSLFEIPVTVVQPHVLDSNESLTFECKSTRNDGSIEFQPNTIQRDFILVPSRATWAVLRMRSTDKNRENGIGKFFIHTMQLLPKLYCRVMENMKILGVNSENEATLHFLCEGDIILELCIAKYWSNYGTTHIKYSLEFHGIQAINTNPYMMQAARGIHKLDFVALKSEDLQPQIQLKTAAVVLRPTEAKITPLSATRDVIPDGRQIYQILFTYTLQVPKLQEVAVYAPLFNSLLYESEFESQLWMMFDSNKAMACCGDAHSHKVFNKLDKGEYTIKLQVRHEKRDLLEKLSETNMIALFKLANTISMEFYDHYNSCLTGKRKFTTCVVKSTPAKVLYVPPLPQEKLTKANLPANCSWLNGTIALSKDDAVRRVDSYDFTYFLITAEKKNGNGGSAGNSGTGSGAANSSKSKTNLTANNGVSAAINTLSALNTATGDTAAASGDGAATVGVSTTANGGSSSPKKKISTDEYAEGLRDFQCMMISKCEVSVAEDIYEKVIAAHPKHSVAHILLMQNIESNEYKQLLPFTFAKMVNANVDEESHKEELARIRKALERVAQLGGNVINDMKDEYDELLAYYGLKSDTRPDAAKIKTTMDKKKTNLLEALTRRGIAKIKISIIDGNMKERLDEFRDIYVEVIKLSDPLDAKLLLLSLWHAYANAHYGRMHKILQKMYEEKRHRELQEEFYLVAGALEYGHLQTVVQRNTVTSYPNSFRVF
ncbi:tripeptidyl-peptidase 2 isoform X2 [Ceratitis capitata]|uniref:tripeptidyl-peptidase 2 isoform X2 n=1 Tax=Ceratitis capitata TaxID=7213 RepID=UPI0003298911|nr:tripeptidyl-peptidase 2 isoform X2 [Ceratitis capitata]